MSFLMNTQHGDWCCGRVTWIYNISFVQFLDVKYIIYTQLQQDENRLEIILLKHTMVLGQSDLTTRPSTHEQKIRMTWNGSTQNGQEFCTKNLNIGIFYQLQLTQIAESKMAEIKMVEILLIGGSRTGVFLLFLFFISLPLRVKSFRSLKAFLAQTRSDSEIDYYWV